jgi:hypothetical protein
MQRVSEEPSGPESAITSVVGVRRIGYAAAAVAALAALALILMAAPGRVRTEWLSWRGGPHGAREPLLSVIAAQPPVTDGTSNTLEIGDRLWAGAIVRTGAGGRATLITRRGSEFTLNENSELVLGRHASRATLDSGQLYCRSRDAEIARIDTDAGQIHLLGTALDAAMENGGSVAVTVVEGRVRLANDHGEATVEAGRRALLVASLPPEEGTPVNTSLQTAWYHGRRDIVSDFGDIAYLVHRKGATGLAVEVWTMKANGSGKRLVRTYPGYSYGNVPWLSDRPWVLVQTRSLRWTGPDFEERRAHIRAGFPLARGQRAALLNPSTGQEVPLELPPGYHVHLMSLSEDGSRLYFTGSYWPDSPEGSPTSGPWLYDLETAAMTRVSDMQLGARVRAGAAAWSSDGQTIATWSTDDQGISWLMLIDVETGSAHPLGMEGLGPTFSPHGGKLAYSSEWEPGTEGRWTSRIFVLDLESGAAPVPISPVTLRGGDPRWSPDGTRIAYVANHEVIINPDEGPVIPAYALWIAAADGSGVQKVHEADEQLYTHSWTPAGDALYVCTDRGIQLVAADGSGLIADLGGTDDDSILEPEADAQMVETLAAIQEAIFQFAVGKVREFEGKPRESTAAFTAASDALAALPWNYPLARLNVEHTLRHADAAHDLAVRSAAEVLAASCERRLGTASFLLLMCVGVHGTFADSLDTLEEWSLAYPWGSDFVSYEDTEWVHMLFRCPVGGEFVYTPPAASDPELGDLVLECPAHPEHTVVWNERLARSLEFHQNRAHRQPL